MMPKTSSIAAQASLIIAVLLWPSAALADPFTVFGPENYRRAAGKPLRVLQNFNVSRPGADYLLRIHNGGSHGEFAPVAAAAIELNGKTVVGPEAFRRKPQIIERRVAPRIENVLVVELRSAPGGGITSGLRPGSKKGKREGQSHLSSVPRSRPDRQDPPNPPPPTASFTSSVVCCPTLNLDASASTGNIVSYTWDLSWTGANPDRITASPTTSFLINETNHGTITLIVTAADGQTATTSLPF